MRLISCAGYYGSGSSALTDLVSEYKDVKNLTDYEFRFVHDTDGIMDLEYHLVMNPNRHNSGHALKRFWRLSQFNAGNRIDKRYTAFLGDEYIKLTTEYVDALTDLKFPGHWFMDLYERGKIYYYYKSLEGKVANLLHLGGHYNKMPGEYTFCSYPGEEKFLTLTRKYISGIINAANPENAEYLMMDQLVPSSNLGRCLRYFDDNIRVVIVDRDPRDIYVMNKTVWHDGIVPSNPEDFCKWYSFTHNCAKGQTLDEKRVLKVQFEDIVYRYSETVRRVEQFIGLTSEKHIKPFAGMNPKRSVHNTWLFKNYVEKEEIKYIEEHLAEYLYDFNSVANAVIEGIEPNSTKVF